VTVIIDISGAIWHSDYDVSIPFHIGVPSWYEGEAAVEVYVHPHYRVHRISMDSQGGGRESHHTWREHQHKHRMFRDFTPSRVRHCE
jgi:hypothetical protein